MLACRHGHIDIVRLLLSNGASLDLVSDDRLSAMDIAYIGGHVNILNMLIQYDVLLLKLKHTQLMDTAVAC